MPNVTVTLEGFNELVARLERAAIAAPPEVGASIRLEGERIAQEAQSLAPVDTGQLQASASVEGDGMTDVTIEFTATAADGYDYALIQHERMDYHHTQGQAKYLEQPFLEASAGLEIRLGAPLKGLFT